MPLHALAGHVVAVLAPLAALMALAYALAPASRRGMRYPTLAATMAAVVAAAVTLTASGSLYALVKASGADITTARAHAHEGEGLAVALLVLLVVQLAGFWHPLAPGRPHSLGRTVAAVLLGLVALTVLVLTWTTFGSAVASVWTHHVLWKA